MSWLTEWMARRHGGMARFYEKFTQPLEEAGMHRIRARLAGSLHGRILEVGCGTGLNFAHYPADARVFAIEPHDEFRAFAAVRATDMPAEITIVEASADSLPFPDHCFDVGFETLVFCSVPDSLQGLRELRRVLRPGAPAYLFEHVRSEHGWVAMVQDAANPLWRWVSDGCNINRDTVALIRAAGFQITRVESHDLRVPRSPRFPMREIEAVA